MEHSYRWIVYHINFGLVHGRAEGGDRGAVAARLRLGHIPAGSTDAVAYSLNGTRAQETAALHIALGDRRAAQQSRAAAKRFHA